MGAKRRGRAKRSKGKLIAKSDAFADFENRRLQKAFQLCKTMTKAELNILRKRQRVKVHEMEDLSSPPKDYTKIR